MSGIFRGRFISEYPREEMRAFLKKWGVRSIAVWSRSSRDYFQTLPGTRLVSSLFPWTFFEFQEGDGRRILSQGGSAEIVAEGYTVKRIRLKDVPKGKRVLLRMNFFPGWHGFFQDKEIPLRNEDGQLAFESPADGEGMVQLRLQTYRPFYFLSGGMLVGILLISLWRKDL